jgi:hypothetical protein
MSLYILQENQKLLWDTISKTAQCQRFGQLNPNGRDAWFRDIISQFYDANRNRVLSINELQNLNRETLGFMVKNLNEMYKGAQHPTVKAASLPTVKAASLPTVNAQHPTVSSEPQPPVTREYFSEKKQGELAKDFDLRQQEYNGMLKPTAIQEIDFRISTDADGPIENMEELIRKQMEERKMDIHLDPIIKINENVSVESKKKVSWSDDGIREELSSIKNMLVDLADQVKEIREMLSVNFSIEYEEEKKEDQEEERNRYNQVQRSGYNQEEERKDFNQVERRGLGAGIQRSWIRKTLVPPILVAETSPKSTDSFLQTDEPAVLPDTPFSSSNHVSFSLSHLESVEPPLSP